MVEWAESLREEIRDCLEKREWHPVDVRLLGNSAGGITGWQAWCVREDAPGTAMFRGSNAWSMVDSMYQVY